LARLITALLGHLAETAWGVLLFVATLSAFYDGHPLAWIVFVVSLSGTIWFIARRRADQGGR